MSRVTIHAFGPVRPWDVPGERCLVRAAVGAETAGTQAQVRIHLVDLDRTVTSAAREVQLDRGPSVVELDLLLPPNSRHGYGLRLEVECAGSVTTETSAVEALDGWWESPRHVALTDYVDARSAAEAVRALGGWHVTVAQHYDWMWRHYRYRPPDGATVFEDALGRTVSHEAVRASIEAGHEAGIAALAYGSVYGAEREYVDRHPDERVFDGHGQPLSLGGTFYINDIRPGSAWRDRLLEQYAEALERFGFDGIHMDTYGPPHTAIGADGARIDFAELYPGLIDETVAHVARVSEGSRVLFNCVEGFPLEAVAPTRAAALYLELWPPDDTYADVVRWIDRARALAEGRQVVIAAYAATLKEDAPEVGRAEAFEAVPLLGAVIAASGAYHHTLAERDRLLVEGYYPAAVAMASSEADEMRALWRFGARYVHLLSSSSLVVEPRPDVEVRGPGDRAVSCATEPEAGAIWIRESVGPDGVNVLHLVDMRAQQDDRWTSPKRVAAVNSGLRLRWGHTGAAMAMSPWSTAGDPVRIAAVDGELELPAFKRWLMLMAV